MSHFVLFQCDRDTAIVQRGGFLAAIRFGFVCFSVAPIPARLRYQTTAAGKRVTGTATTKANTKFHSIFSSSSKASFRVSPQFSAQTNGLASATTPNLHSRKRLFLAESS